MESLNTEHFRIMEAPSPYHLTSLSSPLDSICSSGCTTSSRFLRLLMFYLMSPPIVLIRPPVGLSVASSATIAVDSDHSDHSDHSDDCEWHSGICGRLNVRATVTLFDHLLMVFNLFFRTECRLHQSQTPRSTCCNETAIGCGKFSKIT
jgi:hypothetical protein